MRDNISRYPLSQRHALRDGACVVTRRIQRTDKKHLREGMKNLSLSSRRFRFLSPIAELPENLLRHLTEVDYFDHDAWVALLIEENDPRGFLPAGVGRYVRDEEQKHRAELALLVKDELQGRGIATVLLKQLARTAAAAGVDCFTGTVLDDNAPMLGFLQKIRGNRVSHRGGLIEVEIPLNDLL